MTLTLSKPKKEHKLAVTLSPVVAKVPFPAFSGPMLMTDKTSWFRVTAFNPSDYVKEHIKKGTLVFVDGDVSLERYNDEASGKTLTAVRVVQSMSLDLCELAGC
jgi:hypothetical protein